MTSRSDLQIGLSHHHELPKPRLAPSSQDAGPSRSPLPDDGLPSSLSPLPPATTGHRPLVVPDPVAFRFLEHDPAVRVIDRRVTLSGYELYFVEQWVCSRQNATLVVVAFTGHQTQTIVVGVLSIPADEATWSARLRLYFQAVRHYHTHPKETAVGEIMVTNLNSFPSVFTIIPVPDGDVRQYRRLFIVNENLKRLACAGRSALSLTDPSSGTEAKFLNAYRISSRVPFVWAVSELVTMCQLALLLFGKLEAEYVDGLLCDKTETAIGNWWTELGAERYTFEPTDGILGPSTVAALVGLLIGARNRLHYLGVPIAKDVYDLESTRRGIEIFQTTQKLDRTRQLDRKTLLHLHHLTAKAAAGESRGMQKAVKSTVSDIGGKTGGIVMDMVSGRDKPGMGEVETLDMDRFVTLVRGERAKWLWQGKPRKAGAVSEGAPTPSQSPPSLAAPFGREEAARYLQAGGRLSPSPGPVDPGAEVKHKEDLADAVSQHDAPMDTHSDRDASRIGVFKTVADKMSDARSGLGRIKDVVGGGRRGIGQVHGHGHGHGHGHWHGHADKLSLPTRDDAQDGGPITPSISSTSHAGSTTGSAMLGKAFSWKARQEEHFAALRHSERQTERSRASIDMPQTGTPSRRSSLQDTPADAGTFNLRGDEVGKDFTDGLPRSTDASSEGSIDVDSTAAAALEPPGAPQHLRRRHSLSTGWPADRLVNENRWPRRMSFSQADEAVLCWDEIVDMTDEDIGKFVEPFRRLFASVVDAGEDGGLGQWVSGQVEAVQALDERLGGERDDLASLCRSLGEAYQTIRHGSTELVADQRALFEDGFRHIDLLSARLDYEIGMAEARVDDVDDALAQYARSVEDLERRADEVCKLLETESFFRLAVRTVTGIGTGPNITRSAASA